MLRNLKKEMVTLGLLQSVPRQVNSPQIKATPSSTSVKEKLLSKIGFESHNKCQIYKENQKKLSRRR